MAENQNKDKATSGYKAILEKLQHESWQLELLVSGFAIVGIYSTRTFIADFTFYRENIFFGDLRVIISLLNFIFKAGWLIFFINLVIHIILRGLWIGTIGLRYISQDINYDALGYSDRFTSFMKKKVGSYDDFILRLEKICSVLFSYTFLLFLFTISIFVFFLEFMVIVLILEKLFPGNTDAIAIGGLLALGYLLLGLLVFIDLVSMGSLKKIKNKAVSTVYFYIYRFISFTTLSFLYRPLLYNFLDHPYTRKLFYLAIPYLIIVIFGYKLVTINENPYRPINDDLLTSGKLIDAYYYDDLRNNLLQEYPNEERKINKKVIQQLSLQSFEIVDGFSSFFIVLDRNMIELIKKDTSVTPYKKSGININFLNLDNFEDKNIESLEKARSEELAQLIKQRTAFKKQNNVNQQAIIDSITKIVDSKKDWWDAKIGNAKKEKMDKIMQSHLNNVDIWIDSLRIPLDQCFYFTHPHFKERGLKCFFNTDSISTGLHQFKFYRNMIDKNDQITRDSVFLPILKH